MMNIKTWCAAQFTNTIIPINYGLPKLFPFIRL